MDDAITGSPNSLSSTSNSISNSVLRPVSTYTQPAPSVSKPLSAPKLSTPKTSSSDGTNTTYIVTVILVVILLAVLGINLFSYLAEGTDYLGWIVQKITGKLPDKAKDLVDTTVTGLDLGVDVAAGAVKDAGSVLSRELDLKRRDLWDARDAGIKKGIASRHISGINKYPEHEPGYTESKEDDDIQERHKPGYCYIGTDRGYRSCIKVNSRDQCESKKIFPTMDICINPSLRQ